MNPPPTRQRLRIVGVAAVVVVLGLLGRRLPGLVGDVAGGLLYGVLIYLVLAFLVPGARRVMLALAAAVVGLAVEFAQLTGLPAQLGQAWPPLRLLLGSTFVPLDLLVAVAGAALGMLTDAVTRRRARSGDW